MSVPSSAELNRQVSREVALIRSEADHRPVSTRGRKCRVCHDPEAMRRVNTMLAHGMGPTEIVRNLGDVNSKRRKNDQIGFWSVRDHRENHFNIQEPARAATLRILEEEYAKENGDLLAEGVSNILTARGMLRIIAQKGLEHLVKEDTEVSFLIGLDARLKLDEMEAGDRDQAERAALRRDVGLIQQAVREVLTDEQMKALSHRLDVLRGVASDDDDDDNVIDADVVGDDDDDEYPDEVADFTMDKDEDDELGD
jgi:hypothetical protein